MDKSQEPGDSDTVVLCFSSKVRRKLGFITEKKMYELD
jgi:hypothetical protein